MDDKPKNKFLNTEEWDKKHAERRTLKQNSALHVYFNLLAEELNSAGYDIKETLKKDIEIPWNAITVKELLWRPIQKAQLKKTSTTRLSTTELDLIYDTLNRYLGEKLGIHVPFPSEEEL